VFGRDLLNHLVLENLLLVHDLDGHRVARLGVPGKPDLGEGALAYGSAKLVLPHTSLHLGRTHSPSRMPGSCACSQIVSLSYVEKRLLRLLRQAARNRNDGMVTFYWWMSLLTSTTNHYTSSIRRRHGPAASLPQKMTLYDFRTDEQPCIRSIIHAQQPSKSENR
jgi:hypothetical protein